MTWWEHGYPGGPAVGPRFIRPLYPPDAAKRGKAPSSNGGDVEAVKIAVSRGGHHPWQKFDRAYSNRFAHGAPGGNVSESGLAGAQRQNGIDATGWMGEQTYNMLRCARVPTGLPHQGEPLFDARAVSLLEDFSEDYLGDTSTVRLAALAEATTWIGYTESPAGTNCNTFGAWYGMNYEPWCAMAVTYWYEIAGPSPSFVKGSRYAYCPYIVDDAQARRGGLSTTLDPVPGDVVVYAWRDGDGVYDHVGLFESGDSSSWTAIEANTSTSNQSNGGQVMRRDRSLADVESVCFVRVEEP